MSEFSLKDKVAIVTGAASGIGKGIAETYAKSGAKVAIADLNIDAANAVAKEVNDQMGTDCAMAVQMDVSSEDAVNAGVQKVIDKFGRS